MSDITRESGLAAIAEFDTVGREAFLWNYGFGPARACVLEHGDKRYDSKAIVGAARGYATGTPLRCRLQWRGKDGPGTA